MGVPGSTNGDLFHDWPKLPISGLETKRLLVYFGPEMRVLGDDPRVRSGRGKPAPDLYLVALQSLNATAEPSTKPTMPSECIVFEDSAAGEGP